MFEIIKNSENHGIKIDIMHVRNNENEEVDLVIRKNNVLHPIEIKKTFMPKKEMLNHFKFLENAKEKVGIGGIICLYDKLLKLDEKNFIIPISSVINA